MHLDLGRVAVGYTFKEKFHAWWEGYDLPPQGGIAGSVADLQSEMQDASGETVKLDPNKITLDKLDFLQALWGKGQIRPGSKEQALANSKPLILTDSTQVIEFGAGLGNYARAIAAANICYVDAFESDPLVVEAAQGQQQTPEEEKFASVALTTLDEMPNEKSYARVIFNRYLHRLENPTAMLVMARDQLKEQGVLLLNEYTAGPGGLLPDDTQAMMDGFSAPRPLISREVYCTALEELGFQIRVNEDGTAQHLRDIALAWSDFNKRLVDGEISLDLREMAPLIEQETERWGALSQALQDGTLQYARILAMV